MPVRQIHWFTFYCFGASQAVHRDQGGYSQNFLRQILKIFVTLGLNILRFYRPKANISKVWCCPL
jgi:hypothetical protein